MVGGRLDELAAIGVAAVKIEGRQRSPAYVERVTGVWRQALDHFARQPDHFVVDLA